MRLPPSRCLLAPALCLLALAGADPASARDARGAPFHGLWGTTAKACRPSAEGVNTLEINPNGLYWYETRCRARSIARAALRTWTMRLACEGEGERFQARSRLTLADPDRLAGRAYQAAELRPLRPPINLLPARAPARNHAPRTQRRRHAGGTV